MSVVDMIARCAAHQNPEIPAPLVPSGFDSDARESRDSLPIEHSGAIDGYWPLRYDE